MAGRFSPEEPRVTLQLLDSGHLSTFSYTIIECIQFLRLINTAWNCNKYNMVHVLFLGISISTNEPTDAMPHDQTMILINRVRGTRRKEEDGYTELQYLTVKKNTRSTSPASLSDGPF